MGGADSETNQMLLHIVLAEDLALFALLIPLLAHADSLDEFIRA